eukprot:GEMP01074567.1.p1 GENE.GEMP01074567.1~~GEMP01074567.1.p1  ORF type:complete len:237 (+),score=35.62 GEMP01074567.1:53-763(+)
MLSAWGDFDPHRRVFLSDGVWRVIGVDADKIPGGRLQIHGYFDVAKRVIQLHHYVLPHVPSLPPPPQRSFLICAAPFVASKAFLLQTYLLLVHPPIDDIILLGDMPQDADDFALAEAFLQSISHKYQVTLVTQETPFPRHLVRGLRSEAEPLSATFGNSVFVTQVKAGPIENFETTWRMTERATHLVIGVSTATKVWNIDGVWMAAVGPFDDACCVYVRVGPDSSGTVWHFGEDGG